MATATASSTGCGTLTFSFLCGQQGYHEYRCLWSSDLNKVFLAKHERNSLQSAREIPVEATVVLDQTDENISNCQIKTLVSKHYKEPVDEE